MIDRKLLARKISKRARAVKIKPQAHRIKRLVLIALASLGAVHAVLAVTKQRVPDMRHMRADLVRASRDQLDLKQRISAFLGKLTRNFSLNRHKANHAERRGGGEFALSLEELDECIEDPRTLTDNAEELGKIISEFLYTQPQEMRKVFVRRYFHSESISDIADFFDMSESKVKSILHRMRLSLKDHLTEHEIHI